MMRLAFAFWAVLICGLPSSVAATIRVGEWSTSGSSIALTEKSSQSIALVDEVRNQAFDFVYLYGGKATDAFDFGDSHGIASSIALQSVSGAKALLVYNKSRFVLLNDYGTSADETDFIYSNAILFKAITVEDVNGKAFTFMIQAGANSNFGNNTIKAVFRNAIARIKADNPTTEIILMYSTRVNNNASRNTTADAFYAAEGFTKVLSGSEMQLFLESSSSLALSQEGEVPFENSAASTVPGMYASLSYAAICQVVFKDWDGQVIAKRTCAEGGSVTPPEAPSRAGFAFTGWGVDSSAFEAVTNGFAVTAQYVAAGNSHAVTFKDWDGRVLSVSAVDDGSAVTPPEESPSRTGWRFVGWNCGEAAYDMDTPVVSDLTLEARYEIEYYEVVFKDWEGRLIGEPQQVPYQGAAVAPTVPELPDGKVFRAWSVAFDCVTSDLEVSVVLCDREIFVDSSDFALLVTPDLPSESTVILTEDIALETWSSIPMRAALDGRGHSIHGLSVPLFSELSGRIQDVVFDGLVSSPADGGNVLGNTELTGSGSFGIIAGTLSGGSVVRCQVRGFTVSAVANAAMDKIGVAIGSAVDGAVVDGVSVSADCVLHPSIGTMAGGIVGWVSSTSGYEGEEGCAVLNCTNAASVVRIGGDNNDRGGVGGVVGTIEGAGNREYVVSNCVNRGCLSSSYLGVHHGGIIGLASSDHGIAILDCENQGDVVSTSKSASNLYKNAKMGGILACSGSLLIGGGLRIERCVNRGLIDAGCVEHTGGDPLSEEETRRQAGGIVGDVVISRYVRLSLVDCANYGEVRGCRIGGIAARVGSYSLDDVLTVENCASYGPLVLSEEADSYCGALLGEVSDSKLFAVHVDGCLVTSDLDLIGLKSETVEVDVGECVFRTCSDGYNPVAARKALSARAGENGQSSWIRGRMWPELSIFADPYNPAFIVTVQ